METSDTPVTPVFLVFLKILQFFVMALVMPAATPDLVSQPSLHSDSTSNTMERATAVIVIAVVGALLLTAIAITAIAYHIIKRARRRALQNIEERLNAITSTSRTIQSSQVQEESDSYIYMQSPVCHMESMVYDDITVCRTQTTLLSLRALHRQWSSCSSDAYLNEFDGPPSSLPTHLSRQRSEPALLSSSLPSPSRPPPHLHPNLSSTSLHLNPPPLPPKPVVPSTFPSRLSPTPPKPVTPALMPAPSLPVLPLPSLHSTPALLRGWSLGSDT